jgi:5'-deoxynucleotidase
MSKSFFAYISRMKYIYRWNLMRNADRENIQEHSMQVVWIAHALALIGKKFYGKEYNIENVLALAAYHEAGEVITGDLPTPIKYYDRDIEKAYKKIENMAVKKLLDMLPEELIGEYEDYLIPEKSPEYKIVKAADRICAYLKCIEELKTGNREFKKAKDSIHKSIIKMDMPEADYFMDNFTESFDLTLDELN